MQRILLFPLFLLLGHIALGQNYTQTLRGTLRDADSREALEGAKVFLLRGDSIHFGTLTDADGRFRFDQITIGRWDLRASYLGYEDLFLPNIQVYSGKEVVLEPEMQESGVKVDAVEITAGEDAKPINEMATVSARQFSVDETRRYAGSWNDPARMASNFAGVSSQDDSRNDIIIRGNSPSGVLWRLDGIDIPNPNHFGSFGTTGGPVSILNNNVLDNSDFMTGAFPAQYGNALAGAFDLRMRKGNDEQYEFLGQMGFNGLEFMAEGPISKKHQSSFLASYRYSTLELFDKLDINLGTSAKPKYQDFSFKLNFPSKKYGDISLFGLGGKSYALILESERDTTDFFGPSGNDIVFGTDMGAIGLKHQIFVGQSTFIRNTLSASGSSMTADVDRVDRNPLTTYDFYNNNSTQAKLNYSLMVNSKLSAHHTVRGGIFVDRQYFNLSDSIHPDTTQPWVVLTNFSGASYLIQPYFQWKYRINHRWTATAGLHGQWFALNNTWAIEPRAGIQYQLSERQSLSLAYGEHSQLQPMFVYFATEDLPDGSVARPNENLDFTRSRHFVAGYDLQIAPKLRFKFETYYQQLRNVPVDITAPNSYSLLNDGADYYFILPDSLGNQGTGRNAGIEVTLEKFFGKHYYFLLTNTLFDSRYQGSDGQWRDTKFNNRYTISLLAGVEYPVGKQKRTILGFDARLKMAGGALYTPVDVASSAVSILPVYFDDQAWSQKLADYMRFDIRAKARFNARKLSHEVALDISNITDRQNPLNVVWDRSTMTQRVNYQLGFFPVVQYRIEF